MNDSTAKDLVSVVVPFFRTDHEQFCYCIESIINQSYKRLEIIVVDDGSGEKYRNELIEITKTDSRIIVYNLEKNSGLSAARNYGLSVASGEYVMFVDSDDVLNTYAVELLYYKIINSESDMAIGGLAITSDYNILDAARKPLDESIVMNNVEALKRMLVNNGFGSTACGRLAKKSIWQMNGNPFIEGVLHEDLASMWNVIYNCNKIVWCKGSFYYYYQGDNSSIHKKSVSGKFVQDFFEAMDNRNRKLIQLSPLLSRDIAGSYMILCPQIYIYASICEDEQIGSFYKKESIALFKKHYREAKELVEISKKQKTQFVLFNISPTTFKFLYVISRKLSKRRI